MLTTKGHHAEANSTYDFKPTASMLVKHDRFSSSEASSDVIFFCDADVSNLTPEIVEQIVLPVINNEYDMFIGGERLKSSSNELRKNSENHVKSVVQ